MSFSPEDLLFNESHEWVHLQEEDGAKIGTVGISKFAVEQLNDLVFIELPSAGQPVKQGDSFGEVESVKAVSSLYSPIDGEITEVNSGLADNLDQLSEDPYGAGWMIKVRLADESGLAKLMNHTDYQKQCAEEQ